MTDSERKPEIETDCTDVPVCPKCGQKDYDWWDGLHGNKGDGDSWEANCGSCGEDYKVTMCVSYSFDTKEIEAVKPCPPRHR